MCGRPACSVICQWNDCGGSWVTGRLRIYPSRKPVQSLRRSKDYWSPHGVHPYPPELTTSDGSAAPMIKVDDPDRVDGRARVLVGGCHHGIKSPSRLLLLVRLLPPATVVPVFNVFLCPRLQWCTWRSLQMAGHDGAHFSRPMLWAPETHQNRYDHGSRLGILIAALVTANIHSASCSHFAVPSMILNVSNWRRTPLPPHLRRPTASIAIATGKESVPQTNKADDTAGRSRSNSPPTSQGVVRNSAPVLAPGPVDPMA
jgi:hypothetical protein